ncbi:hypothetical protein TNCV_3961171 [Trichonephila clavipes]|nr:hypothetical protein TNCV_3961171 [Trichonephila clavipes]
MDSTGLDISSKLARLGREETSMSQVDTITCGVPENEADNKLAGRGCDLSNPGFTVLSHSETSFPPKN